MAHAHLLLEVKELEPLAQQLAVEVYLHAHARGREGAKSDTTRA